MLKGKLRYHDEDLGAVVFNIYGRDSFDDTKLYFQNDDMDDFNNYMKATTVYDKGVEIGADGSRRIFNKHEADNPSDNRRLDIKKTNKYKTNITNEEMCSRISALLRYTQMQGKKDYNQNVSEENHFQMERLVNIEGVGYIKFEMGVIKELNIRNKFVELVLQTVENDSLEGGLFKELKAKDNYGNILSHTPISVNGFKLHEDLLGFYYEPPFIKEGANLFGIHETIEDVIEAHPEKNTDWILDRKYEIVTDANLEEVMKQFYDYDGWIAFDTETTGLNINFKSRTGEADQLVGVVLSMRKGEGFYFPLQHKAFDNLCNGDHWYFMEKYMKNLLETKKIICHNIQYDWKVAYIYDIVVNCHYDTMLAFGVTKRYEDPTFKLGLKTLVRNLFGLDMFDLSDFVTGSSFGDSDITFADLPYELVRRYAPSDTDMTLSLFEYIEHHNILDKYEAHTVFEMEVNFAKVVAYSEFFGYHINVPKIPEMKEHIVGGMDKYRDQMFAMAGREFNPNSPKQLMEIMYDELGIEVIGSKPGTGKEILATLADRTDENDEPLYPFVKALKSYRDHEGIFKNFLKKLHIFSTDDGFIFPEVMQLGTNTGRASVKNPNYQGYNDPVKKNITPREGYMHFDCDFSQIEYRVLASMAKQDQLMVEFDDADLDYHTYQASRMFSIPYSLVSKALRGQSKGINFGLPYGMGDSSLGTRIFGVRNKETEKKAGALRRKFFQGQEKIEEFFERVRSEGVANNYTKTHFGRRRYYNREQFTVSEIRRQAGNHVIQGTAADIYKISCNRMFNRCLDEGWLGKVLFNGFIHDELLMEVHKSINPYYFFKAWREEFQLVIADFCQLFAGAGVGTSWYSAKKQDLPPQYIEEVINSYKEDMEWDENIPNFIARIEEGYQEYKVRRIKDYITDPTNSGDIIKPIIYSLLVEMVGEAVKDIQKDESAVRLLREYNTLTDHELIPDTGKHKIKLLSEYLMVFCKYYDINNMVSDIKSADEASVPKAPSPGDDLIDEDIEFTNDSYSVADMIELRGFYRDDQKNIIYFADRPMTYEGVNTTIVNYLFQKKLFLPEGLFQLALFDPKTKEATIYNAYMSEQGYQTLMATYNNLNRATLSFAPMSW